MPEIFCQNLSVTNPKQKFFSEKFLILKGPNSSPDAGVNSTDAAPPDPNTQSTEPVQDAELPAGVDSAPTAQPKPPEEAKEGEREKSAEQRQPVSDGASEKLTGNPPLPKAAQDLIDQAKNYPESKYKDTYINYIRENAKDLGGGAGLIVIFYQYAARFPAIADGMLGGNSLVVSNVEPGKEQEELINKRLASARKGKLEVDKQVPLQLKDEKATTAKWEENTATYVAMNVLGLENPPSQPGSLIGLLQNCERSDGSKSYYNYPQDSLEDWKVEEAIPGTVLVLTPIDLQAIGKILFGKDKDKQGLSGKNGARITAYVNEDQQIAYLNPETGKEEILSMQDPLSKVKISYVLEPNNSELQTSEVASAPMAPVDSGDSKPSKDAGEGGNGEKSKDEKTDGTKEKDEGKDRQNPQPEDKTETENPDQPLIEPPADENKPWYSQVWGGLKKGYEATKKAVGDLTDKKKDSEESPDDKK